MPSFTPRAIKAAFMKLLNEQPLNEISVRDIVEECGINRNSFYYHYQDIPALIEEIVIECFGALIGKYSNVTSLSDGFNAAIRFMLENKKALLHIYNSLSRDVFERYLMKFCTELIEAYIGTAFGNTDIPQNDRNLIVRFLKCELFGAFIDWMNADMPDTVTEDVHRIFEICHGMADEIIQRCRETK